MYGKIVANSPVASLGSNIVYCVKCRQLGIMVSIESRNMPMNQKDNDVKPAETIRNIMVSIEDKITKKENKVSRV